MLNALHLIMYICYGSNALHIYYEHCMHIIYYIHYTFTNIYVIVFGTTKYIVNMIFMIAIIVFECPFP